MEVNNGNESDNIEKNKLVLRGKFNVKESQCSCFLSNAPSSGYMMDDIE